MAVKVFLVFVTVFACSVASPTRRQYKTITEEPASDAPVTSDGAAWDDNDEFDLDGDGWFSQAAASPSSAPQKAQEYSDYDNNYSRGNVVVEFGEGDDDDLEVPSKEDDEDEHLQDAEEDDGNRNDSEFLFLPPKDSRLVLEDDDDDQSGPIKVRHTGRSNYPRVSEGGDNSIESSEIDKDDDDSHPYEFAIDEDDKDDEGDDDDDDDDVGNGDVQKEDNSAEVVPHHEDDDDEDEFVSESDDDDMFDNPEEEAAQVIYGDHVFLY